MEPVIVCISGKAGSGKDTFATMLANELKKHDKEVLVIHYADLLKYICTQWFGWDGKKDELGRQLLQYVGTDVVRKHDEDFWVNHIISLLKIFHREWDCVLIPDTRFPNEITKLKNAGFNVWHMRIRREGVEDLSHSSETSLNNIVPNIHINNHGTYSELQQIATRLANYF